jgi:DHA1 family tetracycline resistance protein-like MFS transporter
MKSRVLPIIFFTVFLDLLSFGILIPVIPELIANPSSVYYLLGPDTSIRVGYIILGFLVAAFPLAQFFASPILGELSDRYGRKPILAISLLGTSISFVLFAIGVITKSVSLLFIARILDGITGGNISVAQASIADVTPENRRSKNFAIIGAAFGFGFILGPFLGGVLSNPEVHHLFNASTPFWFSAFLSFINMLFVMTVLPETLPENLRTSITSKLMWGKAIKNIIKAYGMKRLKAIFATTFLFNGGMTFYTTFLGVFLIQKFDFSQTDIGNYFAYVGVWICVIQVLLTQRVSGKFSEESILRISLIGSSVCILAYFIPNGALGLLIIGPFLAASIGLSMANITGLISRRAGAAIQGEVLGIGTSVQALAQAIPPILSGFIAATMSSSAPIFVSAIILFVSWVFFLFAGRQRV